MRWPSRKTLRWLLASLAVVLVVLVAGIAWLVTTEAGLAATVSALESLDGIGIRVDGRLRPADRAAQGREPRHRASSA